MDNTPFSSLERLNFFHNYESIMYKENEENERIRCGKKYGKVYGVEQEGIRLKKNEKGKV